MPASGKDAAATAAEIREKLLSLGYSGAGVIPAEDFPEYDAALNTRQASFPRSAKMYEFLRAMARVPGEAKSIIVATRPYTRYRTPESLSGRFGKFYLFDGRLGHTEEFAATSAFEAYLAERGIGLVKGGVPDRWAAMRAGLGFFGENNFFYTEKDGSYVVIDTWLTDRAFDLEASGPAAPEKAAKRLCGESCRLCVAACPTGALDGPFSMDRGKCVAHWSFSGWAGIPPEALREGMGRWLYGCDACQDACPMNKGRMKGAEAFPGLEALEKRLDLDSLLEMDEETYKAIVQPWFFYIGPDERWLWRVNVLRAMANSGEIRYIGAMKKHLADEDARVREIAAWGLGRLNAAV